jgi:hypothetical protein
MCCVCRVACGMFVELDVEKLILHDRQRNENTTIVPTSGQPRANAQPNWPRDRNDGVNTDIGCRYRVLICPPRASCASDGHFDNLITPFPAGRIIGEDHKLHFTFSHWVNWEENLQRESPVPGGHDVGRRGRLLSKWPRFAHRGRTAKILGFFFTVIGRFI